MNASFFHVMSQGINREHIFNDKNDIITYKRLIKKYKINTIEIIAYCIMSNHVHLLIYADKVENLTKFMHKINTIYAIYYNNKYKRVGYVFRDRFKSEIIETEYYIKNCIDYIHLNPVKANICKKPELYMHSSYNEYIGKKYIITGKALELVFGNKCTVYEIKDTDEQFIDDETSEDKCKRVIQEFINKNNCSRKEIIEDINKLKELILNLKMKNGISYRVIEAEIGIQKDKLRRMIIQ